MSGKCRLTPGCQHGEHLASDHPCGQRGAGPGQLCPHCTRVVPGNHDKCPDCWSPIDVPTFRALMAAHGIDTSVTREERR